MSKNLDTIRYIYDLQSVMEVVGQHMSRSQRALAAQGYREYHQYFADGIEDVPFQSEVVQMVMARRRGVFAAEVAMGGGKTIIGGRAASEYLRNNRGRVIYVCPSPTALGDERSGIIQGFHKVFNDSKFGINRAIGLRNIPSKAYDVLFFTPHTLVNLRHQGPLYEQLMQSAGMLIIDEAHHFAADSETARAIFGQIEPIARRFAERGRVLCLTGTHGRMDGGTVMGKETPDFKYTVQDANDDGRCPDVHGIQVFLRVKPKSTSLHQGVYRLNFDDESKAKYVELVTGVMAEVWRLDPSPACAFVARVEDAYEIADAFNTRTGLGDDRGIQVMVGDTSDYERQEIINGIKAGERFGYITCGVGAEALDIPALTVCHMIVRTQSITRLMQASGRILRLWPDKQRSLIVDYNVDEGKILNSYAGLIEWATGAEANLNPSQLGNGGPLLVPRDTVKFDVEGFTLSQERAWMISQCMRTTDEELIMAALQMSRRGGNRPVLRSKDKYEFDESDIRPEEAELALRIANAK